MALPVRRRLVSAFQMVRERLWPLTAYYAIVLLVSVLVLAPLVSWLFRYFVSSTGKAVLSDTEILAYFLTPAGLMVLVVLAVAIVVVNAVWAIGFLLILYNDPQPGLASGSGSSGARWVLVGRLRGAVSRAPALLRLMTLVVSSLILMLLPALAVIAFVVRPLLSPFDINYYLSVKPPEFFAAITIGAASLLACVSVGLYVLVHWLLAFPVLLFEDRPVLESLKRSWRLVSKRRTEVVVTLAAWLLSFACVGLVTDFAIDRLAGFVASSIDSLTAALVVAALLLLVDGVFELVLSFFALALLCALLVRIYDDAVRGDRGQPRVPAARHGRVSSPGFGPLPRFAIPMVLLSVAIPAAMSSWLLLRDIDLDVSPRVIAHRGSSVEAPENTLAAIDLAFEEGADLVEVDAQIIADGTVVVIHDTDLKRVAGIDRAVADLVREELSAIDVGSWFSPVFRGEPLPTLGEALNRVSESAGMLIELKYARRGAALATRVLDEVAAAQISKRVEYMSLHYNGIRRVADLDGNAVTGFLSNIALGDLTESRGDFYAVSASTATREFIRRAHALGKRVYVWTVNKPREMALFVDRGVDGIITDVPARLRRVIGELNEYTLLERLLLRFSNETGLTLKNTEQ